MNLQDLPNKEFNFDAYELDAPVLHKVSKPSPIERGKELDPVVLREKANEVERWQKLDEENKKILASYRESRKKMANLFEAEVMDYIFGPSLNYEHKEAVYQYILTTLGVEDSLNQKEQIYHALLGFADLVSEVFNIK